MKIHRTLPPAAAPVRFRNIYHGVLGAIFSRKYINNLEKDFKEYFGVKHVLFLSSGKAALSVILKSLKEIDERREAIIPAYTCFSVPSAIVNTDMDITLCDVDSATFNMDLNLLDEEINDNTLCVIPSNLFGIPVDMNELSEICKDKGVYLIEDAAQAMGVTYNGNKIGTIGDVGFYSLGRGKNITSGAGGVIVTNSDDIFESIKSQYSKIEFPSFSESLVLFIQQLMLSVLIRPALYWLPSGLPFLQLGKTFFYNSFPIKKLSGMQAGFLKFWRDDLESSNNSRSENTRFFNKYSNLNLTCLRYPIILENHELREKLYSMSESRGLGLSLMYPSPINEISEIKSLFIGKVYPVASKLAKCLITLPTHQWLTVKDRNNINNLLAEMHVSSKVIT